MLGITRADALRVQRAIADGERRYWLLVLEHLAEQTQHHVKTEE
jgi:hypothetical protein